MRSFVRLSGFHYSAVVGREYIISENKWRLLLNNMSLGLVSMESLSSIIFLHFSVSFIVVCVAQEGSAAGQRSDTVKDIFLKFSFSFH